MHTYNNPDCFKFWKKAAGVNNVINAKGTVTFHKRMAAFM